MFLGLGAEAEFVNMVDELTMVVALSRIWAYFLLASKDSVTLSFSNESWYFRK